jgi:hypothetical protein
VFCNEPEFDFRKQYIVEEVKPLKKEQKIVRSDLPRRETGYSGKMIKLLCQKMTK